MDKDLFRKEFLKDMAPTWHRSGKGDGVVLGFAKLRARLMAEGRAATHGRSRIVALRWPDMPLVISLPQQKLNCFFGGRFRFLRHDPDPGQSADSMRQCSIIIVRRGGIRPLVDTPTVMAASGLIDFSVPHS